MSKSWKVFGSAAVICGLAPAAAHAEGVRLTVQLMFADAGLVAKLLILLALAGLVLSLAIFAGAAIGSTKASDADPAERQAKALQSLASIRSAALLIAVFGPLVGMMNSFIGVANTNVTNLAVVAPGIAEALLVAAMAVFTALVATLLQAALRMRRTPAISAQA